MWLASISICSKRYSARPVHNGFCSSCSLRVSVRGVHEVNRLTARYGRLPGNTVVPAYHKRSLVEYVSLALLSPTLGRNS